MQREGREREEEIGRGDRAPDSSLFPTAGKVGSEREKEKPLGKAVPIQPPDDLGCGGGEMRFWAGFALFGNLRYIGCRSLKEGTKWKREGSISFDGDNSVF